MRVTVVSATSSWKVIFTGTFSVGTVAAAGIDCAPRGMPAKYFSTSERACAVVTSPARTSTALFGP
jgi:hypothetical protein